MKKAGIYAIINKINGKMYIGQSVNIKKRLQDHKSSLRRAKSKNDYLQKSWNKYGESNFKEQILKKTTLKGDHLFNFLNKQEKYFINYYNTTIKQCGYNLKHGGNNCKMLDEIKIKISKAKLGKKRTKESRRKQSESLKGRKLSLTTRRKLSESTMGDKHHFYGKKQPDEVKIKISKTLKGRKLSKKHRENISKNHKGMLGKTHTRETLNKMSLSKKGNKNPYYGNKHSMETIKKISRANSAENHGMWGKKMTQKTRLALLKVNKGKILSEETKIKMSNYRTCRNLLKRSSLSTMIKIYQKNLHN